MGKRSGRRITALLAASWLVLLVADLAALLGAARLDFDDGLKDAFVSDGAWYTDYHHFAKRFTQTDGDIVVVFESADFARPPALASLSDFALEAGLVDGVVSAVSILTLRGPPGADGATDPLVPAVLPQEDALAPLLDDIRASAPGGAALLSPDRRLAAVLVSLADGGSGLEGARGVIAELDGLADAVARDGGLGFFVAGITPLRAAIVDGLYRDMVVLTGVGIVAGFLVCLVALRSLPLVLGASQALVLLFWIVLGLALPALVAQGKLAALANPDDATAAFLLTTLFRLPVGMRLFWAVLGGLYCTMPMTEFLPLAAIGGAVQRFFDWSAK